jgi:hypothetical protein
LEPTAAVPWSVLISIGASLITVMGGIIVALLGARIRKLEDRAKESLEEAKAFTLQLHAIETAAVELRGIVLWLKASESEMKGSHVPREIVLQRLEQQDMQLARIESALERKVSVSSMRRIDPRTELPPSDPPAPSLPPMRGKLPSRGGR